jgi:hypothetical protein
VLAARGGGDAGLMLRRGVGDVAVRIPVETHVVLLCEGLKVKRACENAA